MANPGRELSSIDFESLIGGPLIAVINAQAQSAMTTVGFVKEVGFKQAATPGGAGGHTSTSDPIYVEFTYPKEVNPFIPAVAAIPADPSATPPVVASAAVPAQTARYEDHKLRVPLLTMIPIPYLRVEETTIDFNAKINSVQERSIDATLKTGTELSGGGQFKMASVSLKSSFSFQMNTRAGSRVERNYSMAVHVRAVQDEMPGGMERIISILEDAITATPSGSERSHPVEG